MATSAARARARTTLLHSEPQLYVGDLEESCSFYVERLGFEIGFFYGEPPFYAQVVRQGARLNLRATSHPPFDPGFRAVQPDLLAATIVVDDPEPLFEEFEQRGVEFHQPLRIEPWGARTFIVRDPDGNLVCFAGAGAEECG